MLARTFKTAEELQVSKDELGALIKVLGMLERKELTYMNEDDRGDNGFNISTCGDGCGTPACIGGWVARILDVNEQDYVHSHYHSYSPLRKLYWGYMNSYVSVESTAQTLGNFLVTGNVEW